MVGAAFVFAVMGALIKLAAARYSVFEIVFYRGLVATVAMGAWVAATRRGLGSSRFGLHMSRSVVGVTAMAIWFHTIGVLPLGTAVTLNYTSPLFMALIIVGAGWFGGRKVAGRGWLHLAIVASFAGVVLVLQPTVERDHSLEFGLGLLSGFLGALAYLQVRALGRIGEPPWRTVFWFSVVCTLFGAIAATATGWHRLNAQDATQLLMIGTLASLGQLMMTRAYAGGQTLLVANLQYVGVVFATSIGWFAFGDRLDAHEIAGMLLIVASGIAATRIPAPTSERHAPLGKRSAGRVTAQANQGGSTR